jgi:chitodextrinase
MSLTSRCAGPRRLPTPAQSLLIAIATLLALAGPFAAAPASAAARHGHHARHHHHRRHHKARRHHRRLLVAHAARSRVSVSLTAKPSNPSSSTASQFAWSTSGSVTGTSCSVDSGAFQSCGSPATLSLPAGSHKFIVKAFNSTSSSSASYSWTISAPAAPDTTAPSVPGGLAASAGDTQVALSWSASTDPDGPVAGYYVYRDGMPVTHVSGTSYVDTGLSDGTSYSYTVAAYDAAGNVSAQSTAVGSTPQAGTGTTPPPPVQCTIYVSPSGGGSGATSTSPTSLSTAVGQVTPGDVVCLEPGTYTTSTNVTLGRSGTSSAPITFTGWGGTAVVQYSGPAIDGGVFQTTYCKGWCASHDFVIENLTLDGGNAMNAGVFVRVGARDVTIRNCVIRNTGATGIALNAVDYVTAENNQIYHAGYNQGWSSGISLWYGGTSGTYGGSTAWYDTAPGFHNFIVGNVVSGSYDSSTNHTDGNGIIVDGSGSTPPALIANNLVYENGGAGIEVYHNDGDIWVVNNTAYANGLDLTVSNGQSPDYIANYSSSVHFTNDLAYGRKNGSSYTSAYIFNDANGSTISWATSLGYNGSTVSISSGITGNGAYYRYANPLFTNLPAVPSGSTPWASATPPWSIGNDFTLQPGSPGIDAGTVPTAGMNSAEAASAQPFLATDIAGNPRIQGQGTDIGAYEN